GRDAAHGAASFRAMQEGLESRSCPVPHRAALRANRPAEPPLSRDLRDFADTVARAAYSFGEPRKRAAAFQSIILLRSFCLSVSGAVAPSAPDLFGPVSPAGIL